MESTAIPRFPQHPPLDDDLIAEITVIVFGKPVSPRPCDLIFVFGGSHPGLWIKSHEAYLAGLGKEIIVTGGHKPTATRHKTWHHGTTPEAHVIRQELTSRGIPEEKIHVEAKSTNTLENVLYAQEVYDFSTTNSILAVCKSYGVGRQCRTLKRHISTDTKVIPYPFDTSLGGEGHPITRDNWMSMPDSTSFVFGQMLKIIEYGSKGHLEPIEKISDKLLAIVKRYIPNL